MNVGSNGDERFMTCDDGWVHYSAEPRDWCVTLGGGLQGTVPKKDCRGERLSTRHRIVGGGAEVSPGPASRNDNLN
jgi:hypothetical protein